MSGPPGDRDPQPLVLERVAKPSRGWRAGLGRLATIGVASSLFVVVAAAVIFRPSEPPQTATLESPSPTTSPSRTPRPTPSPTATPLPNVVTAAAPQLQDARLVSSDAYRILDLASGESRMVGEGLWKNIVLPRPNGGWLCACAVRSGLDSSAGGPLVALDLVQLNETGQSAVTRRLLAFTGVPPPNSEAMDVAFWTAALSADGRWMYLLTLERQPPSWLITFHAVDVVAGEVVQSLPLGTIATDLPDADPAATPRPESGEGVYVWPSTPLWSTDRRTLVMGLNESRQWENRYVSLRHGWAIPLRNDGQAEPPVAGPVTEQSQDYWCMEQSTFVDPARIVDVCVVQSGGREKVALRTVDTVGVEQSMTAIEDIRTDGGVWPPLIDVGARVAFLWEPVGHVVVKFDLRNPANTRRAAVPQDELEPIRAKAGSNDRGSWLDPPAALSPDRSRLYVVGLTDSQGGPGGTTGVWVFDAETVELIDHWQPTANFTSIDVSDDGRFVYAMGAPGSDAEGRASSWPASLTVYDAETGEVVRIFNDLGMENQVNFARRPPA